MFWEPHSSSIDFCEPNYHVTPYIAEFHNSWSSLCMSIFALIGIMYGNPLGESRVTAMFSMLFVIGFGSCGLHSTLHWLPQSSDEVPMLWQCWTILFALTEYKTAPGSSSKYYTASWMSLAAGLQTVVYYMFQDYYPAFLVTYSILAATIIIWLTLLTFRENDGRIAGLFFYLWLRSIMAFLVIGFSLWVVDNHFCKELMPLYANVSGATLHIIWHLGAGLGCYYMVTLCVCARLHCLGHNSVALKWKFGFMPICTVTAATASTSNGSAAVDKKRS